jgi:hypothetical protein
VSGSEAAKMSDALKQQLRGALGDKWKVFPFFILFFFSRILDSQACCGACSETSGRSFVFLFFIFILLDVLSFCFGVRGQGKVSVSQKSYIMTVNIKIPDFLEL